MEKFTSRKAIFNGMTLFIDVLWLLGIAAPQTACIASLYCLLYNVMKKRDD